MPVENKGWVGGRGSSAADAMWENMWSGAGSTVPAGNVTDGPLAQFPEGYDPIATQRALSAEHEAAMGEKTARVLGNDNDFDSSTQAGSNRVQQKNSAGGQDTEVQQTPQDARGPAPDGGAKKDSAPSKGSKGGDLMRRLKAKSGDADPMKTETATKSVGGDSQGAGHNLVVKEPAPLPKELDPDRRMEGKSHMTWTGSGPQAALHHDYQKVGELVDGLLAIAGVPPRPLPETSLLFRKAAAVASAEMSKTANLASLSRNDVHPLKVVAELSDSLGEDWVDWEPETIRDTLTKEAGVEPSDEVMNKIMAVKIVLAAPDRFYDDWKAMEKISVALNDVSPMMGTVEDVPVEWLSNAVAVVEKIAGVGDFGPAVTKYVAARLYDQGYVVAPPKLAFANAALGDLVGNDAMREKVILAYARALGEEDAPSGEDPVSIQVARLLRNHAYVLDKLDESREQMA